MSPTDVQDQTRSLVIRNPTVRIVWVLALLKLDHQPLVFSPTRLIHLERVNERLVAHQEREPTVRGCVELFEEKPFDVSRPAFVEPEVGGVGVLILVGS